ncbi:MAG: phosphatidylglycerol lysyltransferase domain-containing protein, partial [Gammaproteobacteria bacterium]
MLSQTNEPPGSRLLTQTSTPSDAPAVNDSFLSLHVNKSFPASYLAIEGQRLYPLTIDVKPLFEEYIRRIQAPLSDYTFANNVIWLSRMSGFYQVIEDCFCLFTLNGDDLTMLLPPLGYSANQHRALQSCFEIMDAYNTTPYVGKVEYVYRDFLDVMNLNSDETVFPAVSSEQWLVERSLPDYIYHTEDLIDLKGNAYKTKRGEINQFRRIHPNHRMEVLGPQHWEGIHNLVNTWLQNRLKYTTSDSVADFFFTVESERAAITRALEHYDFLQLQG